MTRVRVAVLASGGGSNLQALLDHAARLGDRAAYEIVLVGADRECGALDRARRAGIATATVESRRHPEAPPLELMLDEHAVRFVALAGFLRLVPPEAIARYRGRMINIHPGPLPRFGGAGMYGARVHRAVLAAGVEWSGPTVHEVDEIYDHGRRLAHWRVPVLAGDDEHTLAARVLRAEHLLYPRMLQLICAQLPPPDVATGAAASWTPPDLPPFDPELDDAALAHQLDVALAR